MDDSPYPPQQAQPTRPKWLMPLLIAAAVLVVVAGVVTAWALTRTTPAPKAPAHAPTSPAPLRIAGALVLHGTGVLNLDNSACQGMSGYDDITEAAQVVVTDPAGKTVGTSHLTAGELVGSGYTRECHFTFYVIVPAGLGFYGVEVSHRGRLQYAEADIESTTIQLTLG